MARSRSVFAFCLLLVSAPSLVVMLAADGSAILGASLVMDYVFLFISTILLTAVILPLTATRLFLPSLINELCMAVCGAASITGLKYLLLISSALCVITASLLTAALPGFYGMAYGNSYLPLLLDAEALNSFQLGTILLTASCVFIFISSVLFLFDACQYHNNIDTLDKSQFYFLINFTALVLTIVIGALVFSSLEGWTYRQGVYFSVVTLTTIGYGNRVPTTNAGKLFLIFYGLFGLGLVGLVLTEFGAAFVNVIHALHQTYFPPDRQQRHRKSHEWIINHLTQAVIVVAVVVFWMFGSLIYWLTEPWTFLDSVYFSFQTLATIGYGDFTPTTAPSLAFSMFYVFTGLGLFSAFISTLWNPESLASQRQEHIELGPNSTSYRTPR